MVHGFLVILMRQEGVEFRGSAASKTSEIPRYPVEWMIRPVQKNTPKINMESKNWWFVNL